MKGFVFHLAQKSSALHPWRASPAPVGPPALRNPPPHQSRSGRRNRECRAPRKLGGFTFAEDLYTRGKCCMGNETRRSRGDPTCWMDGYSYEERGEGFVRPDVGHPAHSVWFNQLN